MEIDSVLFIGFGGPTAPDEIRPFLQNVVRGRNVPPERVEEVAHHYEAVGGRSPYNALTFGQAEALRARLAAEGTPLPVYVGMRNWHPYLKETIAAMLHDGRHRAVGVILAAHRSPASDQQYRLNVERAKEENGSSGPDVAYLDPWHTHPLFLEAQAARLEEASGYTRGGGWPASVPLIFTAHSIPTSMAQVSPYAEEIQASSAGVAAILGATQWLVAYQSRSGDLRTPWLEPDVNDVIRDLAAAGTRELAVAPIGFLCDHVEVLYDLDIEAKATAAECGVRLHRAGTVGDHPSFIQLLAEMIHKNMRVIVIGGGITGLAAAHRLTELARERGVALELRLLEASDRLGGIIGTERRDGFLLEAGPDLFITDKPWGLQLCRRIGLEERLIGTNTVHRRSFVVRGRKLHPVPEGFQLLAPTRFWPLATSRIFSWPGKLRMGLDLVLPRRRDGADESVGAFVQRRLGREALERMAQPMVGGIYGANPHALSLEATLPRFRDMERKHRSVIRAMLAARGRGSGVKGQGSGVRGRGSGGGGSEPGARTAANSGVSGARYGLFVSFDEGMQVLVDALMAHLPPGIVTFNARVRKVARIENPAPGAPAETPEAQHPTRWRALLESGDAVEAEAVCIALPAYQTAALIEEVDLPLAARLLAIPYASSATVNLAYRRADVPHALDGFGFVVPAREGRAILGCTFSGVKFPGRAPQGHALLRAFLGEPYAREPADDEMEAAVREDLRLLLGIQAAPLWVSISRHPNAMAQYPVGHLDRVAELEGRVAQLPGLALAGNAFRGIGIPDCVRSGEAAAEAIMTLSDPRA